MSWKPPQPPTPSELAIVAAKLPLSESTKKRNLGITGLGYDLYDLNTKQKVASHKPKPRMNKLELRFFEVLKQTMGTALITPQFRLRLSTWDAPIPVHYTGDFLVSTCVLSHNPDHPYSWRHTLYEVKDSRRKPHSDELTRPKMVREHNPWISSVILATWDGHSWTEKQIA